MCARAPLGWPEATVLKREVCAGRMTLADAQAGIAGDWTRYLGASGGAPASEEN